MSSGLPYLKSLRKPDLIDFAERTDLQEYVHTCRARTTYNNNSCRYEDYNKNDLATALDKHLSENRSIFGNDSKLSKFYERLGASTTPAKTPSSKRKPEAKVEISPVKKTPGRKPKAKTDEP
jgi:hypothetical protein